MDLHLTEKAEELEAAGMPPERARLEARRQFGSVARKHEESREVWLTRFLSELAQDIRYGARSMAANKTFSALAVLSLALGIGANTAIYSFMEAILLRSLPVADPESLVVFNWQSPPPHNANKEWVHVMHGISGLAWPGAKGIMVSGMFPHAAFERMRDDNPVFSTVFGYYNGRRRTVSVNGQALLANAEYVTGGYFRGLAVSPAAGRLVEPADDHPSAPPVAVISFSASQQRFGGPAAAIGQPILVDNIPFTVIGVTPPAFFGVDPAIVPEIYLPLQTILQIEGPSVARDFTNQNHYWIEMMGRLRPGVTMAQAQAALAPRFHQWVEATASTDGERAKLPALVLNPGAAGLGGLRREYAKPIAVLLAMVGLILAITCANVANLLLARASVRRREIAVRLSLGAGRFRVVRQLLTESVLLASLGGAFGVLFAVWSMRTLTFLFSRGQENFTLHAGLNGNVLALTAALSVLCGVLFGLVPALQATGPDVMPALKNGRGGGTRHRTQQILVVAQIAMSFLILFAAGLFVRTLNQLHSVQLGYARENILLFTMNARQAGHRDPEIVTFYMNLRKRFEELPGVQSASFSHATLIASPRAGGILRGPIKAGPLAVDGARVLPSGPRYLSTMQIPLLAGREIDGRDQPNSPPVAVISERLARTYFGAENPIGRRISFPEEKRDFEIIGVSADLRNGSVKDEGAMSIFVPLSQVTPGGVTYALRSVGDPLRFANSVRELVRQADAAIPVTNIITQATEIDRSINREILFANLCTGFAILALLTACVGLYGVMSYSVTRQMAEIGIRMALGAQRRVVIWMVLRRVLLLAAAGLAVSVPVALMASRLVKSFLFGTQPNDPGTLALAGAILLGAAILAGYAPARRAARMDPLTALRQE